MNTPAKLVSFAAVLALVFGGAVGVGRAVGPGAGAHGGDGMDSAAHGGGHQAATTDSKADFPKGLMVSQDGFTLRPAVTTLPAGTPATFSFTVLGPDGTAVREYTPTHDKELHLIVVRRDLTGFQHVHPTRDSEGLWSVPMTLAEAGTYRVFADFAPASRGEKALTLGADLTVAGNHQPQPLPAQTHTAIVDGYTVTLDGQLRPGTSSPVTLTVEKDGEPVSDLQPYLAAYGHLVALRVGDLAYLHVHPDGEPGDGKTKAGPAIKFFAEVPSTGTYRLFLDFQHQGLVRTAAFTAVA